MSTVQLCAPAHNKTITLRPGMRPIPILDPYAAVFGLPAITTPDQAIEWGFTHGLNGMDIDTSILPLDLVDHAREGWQLGQDERVERAQLDRDRVVIELSETCDEGVAHWAVLPEPADLAESIRRVVGQIAGDGPGEVFVRRLLDSVAGDVEIFRARTFAEYDGAINVMTAKHGEAGGR